MYLLDVVFEFLPTKTHKCESSPRSSPVTNYLIHFRGPFPPPCPFRFLSLSLSLLQRISPSISLPLEISLQQVPVLADQKKKKSTTLPHSHTSKISRIEFVNPFNLFRTKSFLNPVLVQIKSTFHFFSSKQKKPLSHFVSCLNLAIELEIY